MPQTLQQWRLIQPHLLPPYPLTPLPICLLLLHPPHPPLLPLLLVLPYMLLKLAVILLLLQLPARRLCLPCTLLSSLLPNPDDHEETECRRDSEGSCRYLGIPPEEGPSRQLKGSVADAASAGVVGAAVPQLFSQAALMSVTDGAPAAARLHQPAAALLGLGWAEANAAGGWVTCKHT